jgi:hypothetical protein
MSLPSFHLMHCNLYLVVCETNQQQDCEMVKGNSLYKHQKDALEVFERIWMIYRFDDEMNVRGIGMERMALTT